MASTSLSRTPASAGNRQTWTISYWVKRSTISTNQGMFSTYNGTATINTQAGFRSDDSIDFYDNDGSYQWNLTTTQKFRDTSAWYHFVFAVDTTQATASDRVKMYVNGEQITSFSTATYPSLNFSGADWNSNVIHYIGKHSTNYFDGYISEFYNIDGQALDASYFGQTNSTGIWSSKTYSGSYGTNGFYLKFSNSGSLGADSSGNGNDFTKTGSGYQTVDTPTNGFCTLNPLYKMGSPTASVANTQLSMSNQHLMGCTHYVLSTGKWYYEAKFDSGSEAFIGWIRPDVTIFTGNTFQQAGSLGWYSTNGSVYKDGDGGNAYSSGYATGSIIGCALNLDDNQATWYKNGVSQGTISITAGNYTPNFCTGGASAVFKCNFGMGFFGTTAVSSANADDNGYGKFEYAPPTGYLAICTKNLASEVAPTINTGSDYMNTVLYTGNGSTQSIAGTGFQPDMVWLKVRNGVGDHGLWDSSRGTTKRLVPNVTNAESTTSGVTSFDSDGFTLGSAYNASSSTYAAWNWLANGGTTSSNTDGSITSTVQANTTAGFSIVTYTGTGSAGTVGHGLGVAPKMVIVKRRDSTGGWWIQNTNLTSASYGIRLDTDGAEQVASAVFNNTFPTSTVFSLGNNIEVNTSSATMVAYCFAEIEGYSKFGKYRGNGSTDGTFVFTGFKPAVVIWKRTDSATDWRIVDTKRDTYNVMQDRIFPNQNSAEVAADVVDYLSNGFKFRNTNAGTNFSGGTYIYAAWAENPFVTSGGLPVTAR